MERTEATVRNMLGAIEAPLYDVGVLSDRGMLPGLDAIPAATVLAKLSLLKYRNACGSHIYIRPSGEHRYTALDDLSEIAFAKLTADGFTPCAIVETSAGNFQAWLKHSVVPSADPVQLPREWVATAHPLGKHVPQTADKPEETEPNTMFNKVILIGRLGQNAEAKATENNKDYVVFNIANPGKLEERQGRVRRPYRMASRLRLEESLEFAKTLQKGQLITLEGVLRYREVENEIKGVTFKHRIAEIHAVSMKRLSKVEAADDPSDRADDE